MDLYRCLRSFKDVIDQNSFAAAARKRYRPASQLSKEIAWLEAEVNSQLIIRTTRKLSLTEAGEQFYQYASKALNEYHDIKQALQQDDPLSGQLRISVPVAFGESVITDVISQFMVQYPNIQLDVNFENRYVDLLDNNIDVALRTHKKNHQTYHYQFFVTSQRMIYVSPSCIAEHGVPKKPDDLEHYPCLLHSDMVAPARWSFITQQMVNVQERYRCNSVTSLVNAAVQGLGCIYLSAHQLQLMPYLARGELVPVLADFMPTPVDLYFCTAKQTYVPQKITAFIEFAEQQLGQQ